ncbi:MAG: OmpA family protein [Pseudomonadota bacterium]|uniref:OmpA family protein n=1 Tax=Sphingomonas sp. ERG5 TaxID=1381597 RepID=UPI00068E627B|nr:OmpA family protein [Sphingomonas sp. ERG5]
MMFGRISIILTAMAALLLGGCATPQPRSIWSAEQLAVLKEENFVQTGRGWEFTVDDRLLFATDESQPSAGQTEIIGRIAKRLLSVGIQHAEVEGHTDKTGTTEYNDQLSKRRADAVAALLTTNGFVAENVRATGLGERFPIETNASATGRRENRRVVILITSP